MRPLLSRATLEHTLKKDHGFTLIEILVAMVLVVIVLSISLSNPFSSRDDLDKDVNSIERAIRFMSDEAALRNTVVRLHFNLDKDPQEYAVEYGPSDNFILPSTPQFETSTLSKEEEEERKKETRALNQKFNRVAEFQEKTAEMGNNIKVMGVATPQSENLQSHGEVSIYTFPTGEKDDALVIIASDEDIISLKIDPFTQNIDRHSYPLGEAKGTDLGQKQEALAKEIFEKWKKEK